MSLKIKTERVARTSKINTRRVQSSDTASDTSDEDTLELLSEERTTHYGQNPPPALTFSPEELYRKHALAHYQRGLAVKHQRETHAPFTFKSLGEQTDSDEP